MDFENIKSITIPEGEVVEITCNGVVLWKGGHTNLVPLSTEADGKTIYNGGLGYKDKYRVRSGGADGAADNAVCIGFIPFVKGDKLYIYPPFTGQNINNAINFYDGSYTHLGQVTDSGALYGICVNTGTAFKTKVVNGVSVLDISAVTASGVEDIAYVRVTNDRYACENDSGAGMIIAKNEEIEL